MTEIASDSAGVTDISLEALKEYADTKRLKHVTISPSGDTVFVFDDDTFYTASGFAIGYGGEGPHGLHRAIRFWHPNVIDSDFWNTKIAKLDPKVTWTWTPENGFIRH